MNRLDELNALVGESNEIPDSFDLNHIKKTTKKRVMVHRITSGVRNLVIALVACVGALTIGVNASPAFAAMVEDIPILGNLARIVEFNKSVESAMKNNYGSPVDIVIKGNQYDLYVDYVMADDRSIVLFFKTEDNGGKNYFQMEVKSLKDTKTGELLEASYKLPVYRSDGKYGMLRYEWDEYHDSVSFELVVKVLDGETLNEALAEEEQYKLDLTVPEEYEAKVFDINQTIQVDDATYSISQVRIYPLSTEIDVKYLNPDNVITMNMNFELIDSNGTSVEKTLNGVTGYGDTNDIYTYVLESGYFNLEGELSLKLDSVELLSAERRVVTLDLNTGIFSDSLGRLPELSDLQINEDHENVINLVVDNDWTPTFIFDHYIDANGKEAFLSLGSRTDDSFLIWPEEVYVNEENQIKLIRSFPDRVIHPNLEFDLK